MLKAECECRTDPFNTTCKTHNKSDHRVMTIDLPTTPGSIITWSGTLNSVRQYCAAILSVDDETGELEWWVTGFDAPRSPAKMFAQLTKSHTDWEARDNVRRRSA